MTLSRTSLLSLVLLAPAVLGQEPRFVRETPDPDTLHCRVLKIVPLASLGTARILIEVRNKHARFSCEPLRFDVAIDPRKKGSPTFTETVERAGFPRARRYGRPVPPGGTCRYRLQASLPKGARATVVVRDASWFEGEGAPAPEVRIGAPTQDKARNLEGADVAVTRVTLENPGDKAVDAVFLARFTQPRDVEALIGVRLEAGSTKDVVIPTLPSRLGFDLGTPWRGVRVTGLELVDWCYVAPPDHEAARAIFMAAYAPWLRWRDEPRLQGRFAYHSGTDEARQSARGRFSLTGGQVRITLDDEDDDATRASRLRNGVRNALVAAFADLRRPDATAVAADNRFCTVGPGTIRVEGPGFAPRGAGWSLGVDGRSLEAPNYTVAGGRITHSGLGNGTRLYTWRTQALGGGYVVTHRQNASGQWYESYSYGFAEDLPVPLAYTQHFGMPGGGLLKETTLRLADLEIVGAGQRVAAEPNAPTGPGVDALRAAWNHGYRYGAVRGTLRGRFEVRTPGTDLVWRGHKKVVGNFELGGFRGFMMDRSGFKSLHVEVSTAATDTEREGLAMAFSDRLLLWSFRDFNGRGAFDEVFAGAAIEGPDAAGVFKVDGANYRTLTVHKGRITGYTLASGVRRTLSWSRAGRWQVVTRVRTGEEDLAVKFTLVDGEPVVSEMTLRGVFGRDWGPEHLRFRDLRLR